MPNRYTREAAIESKRVNSLSWQGEVFWRRLINRVDDFGRYTADHEILRSKIFPRQLEKVRETDIPRLLAECETAGLLYVYTVDSKAYLVMDQWEKGRAKKSHYPEPPPEILKRMQTYVYTCTQMSPTPTPTPVPPPPADATFPTVAEVLAYAQVQGIPAASARKFFEHHEGQCLWLNKHNRLIKWQIVLKSWAETDRQPKPCRTYANHRPTRPDRNAGTHHEGKDASDYAAKLG